MMCGFLLVYYFITLFISDLVYRVLSNSHSLLTPLPSSFASPLFSVVLYVYMVYRLSFI